MNSIKGSKVTVLWPVNAVVRYSGIHMPTHVPYYVANVINVCFLLTCNESLKVNNFTLHTPREM